MFIGLVVAGLFLGVLARTYVPYLRKLRGGEKITFRKKYVYTAIGSIALALISVLLIFPTYQVEPVPLKDVASMLRVFATAFSFGFMWNSITNEAAKWMYNPKAEEETA
jgi:hypothetical protein